MKLSSAVFDRTMCPLNNMTIGLLLAGICASVDFCCQIEGILTTITDVEQKTLLGIIEECNKALEAIVYKIPEKVNSVLKGMVRNFITWHHCVTGVYLILHPCIYGQDDFNRRVKKVATSLRTLVLGLGWSRTLGRWR